MYSYIRGELAEINTDHIVVEAAGVGYGITVPTLVLENLPSIGNYVKIYTYLSHREDAMCLYGFLNREDLEFFKLLLTVSGIGPKGAIGILSLYSAEDLQFAILSQDAKAISKAPGIGAKTAQRVILELKDKVSLEDAFEKKTASVSASAQSGVKQDAILALTALGYSSSESLKAVSAITITEEMTVETVLQQALKHLL